MSAYAKLSRRRQRFVDEYVGRGVGTEAIIAAGYKGKNATVVSSHYLTNPDIKAAIAERTAEAIAKAGARHVKFVEEVCALAYARLTALRGKDGLPIRELKELPEELLAAAESIEFDDSGKVKKLKVAKTAGMRMLGELMKAFTQVHEHSGPGGKPIETKELSDLEVARRVAFLLTQGMRSAEQQPTSSTPPDGPAPPPST